MKRKAKTALDLLPDDVKVKLPKYARVNTLMITGVEFFFSDFIHSFDKILLLKILNINKRELKIMIYSPQKFRSLSKHINRNNHQRT